MKTILIGSCRYDPTPYIIDILTNDLENTDSKIPIRVHFLDHRIDTRLGMTQYMIDNDMESDRDVTYRIRDCTLEILDDLMKTLTDQVKHSKILKTIIFFDVDSIDLAKNTDLNMIVTILDKFQTFSEIINLNLICLTTSSFLGIDILNRFDEIHIFRETSKSSLDELTEYFIRTDKYYESNRLRKLISLLDERSSKTINIDSLLRVLDREISEYGRIVVT